MIIILVYKRHYPLKGYDAPQMGWSSSDVLGTRMCAYVSQHWMDGYSQHILASNVLWYHRHSWNKTWLWRHCSCGVELMVLEDKENIKKSYEKEYVLEHGSLHPCKCRKVLLRAPLEVKKKGEPVKNNKNNPT